MISPIEALADCIMRFEGWFPPSQQWPSGSTSWRNRNPGNLRSGENQQGTDERGYAVFVTLTNGWTALLADLDAKFKGSHNLTPQSTLHDLFNIYAPSLDQNNPTQYSAQIAKWLNDIYKTTTITPDTTLGELIKLGAKQ